MEQSDEIIIRRENGQLIVNDLGMKVINGDLVAYYNIDELLEIIHGETKYPLGRGIFVRMLVSLLKEEPLNEDTQKYYREVVTEVLGMSYNPNIQPEVMFEALEKAEKEHCKLEFRGYSSVAGKCDGWGVSIYHIKEGEHIIGRSQDLYEKDHALKIVSYNINHCTQSKIDHLLTMDADFYIVPEMSNPKLLNIPDMYETKWIGDYPKKGLGVIWRRYLDVKEASSYVSESYFIPLIVEGNLIVAAWPTKTKGNEKYSYPEIAAEALKSLEPDIQRYPAIISGDFNCYVGQSGETKYFSIDAIAKYLKGYGMRSIYHNMNGEQLGKETACTYHHLFKSEDYMKFFIDYTFANIPVKGYYIKDWEPKISDHHAQVIII